MSERGDSGPVDWEEEEEERLASRSLAAGDPTGWFDRLYAAAATGRVAMPWSRGQPHPLLVEWAQGRELTGVGRQAVVVGCGLGADAEYLARLGFDTVGFDISETAIQLAEHRFPDSAVRYVAADLLDPPHRGYEPTTSSSRSSPSKLSRPTPPPRHHQRQPPGRSQRNTACHCRRPRRRRAVQPAAAVAAAADRDRGVRGRRARPGPDRDRQHTRTAGRAPLGRRVPAPVTPDRPQRHAAA